MINPFWSTRALTAAREDHLTEFFAAALDVSPSFRESYFNLVLATCARTKEWGCLQIDRVQTQVSFEGTTCCPDMILWLSNGKTIACEHKLDAIETLGPEQNQKAQLERYLALPIEGLVYVRTSWKPPSAKVLEHPKYIHPAEREHFLWRDFYPTLGHGQHVVIDWLREGFERLGFTHPHPSVGEMSGPNKEMNQRNRQNFAKLWGRTRSHAHGLGWKVTSGSIVELYLTDNQSSLASWVFISPAQFERFLFRVTPRKGMLSQLTGALQAACSSLRVRTEVAVREVTRKEGKESVIDVTTSLRDILGDIPLDLEEIEDRLLGFTEPLLLALQK